MTIPYHGRPDLVAMAGSTDSRSPAPASAGDAGLAAQHAVARFAGADGAQTREWPARLGASIARRYAELLAEVRAAQIQPETAVLVRAAQVRPETAAPARREQAERARGDGVTWEQIGEALGLDAGPDAVSGYDLGIAAFEHFTGEPGAGYPASFRFCCASCGEYITDHGPFDSHPEGNERGHAAGCVRLAADITGWRAQQEAWQPEGRPVTLAAHSMARDSGGSRAAWPPGRRGRPWLGGHGHHARRAGRRPRGRLVR